VATFHWPCGGDEGSAGGGGGGGGYHHGKEEGEMSVFMMAASGDVGSLVFATFTPKSSKSFCI
jgi:hypothetical protein